MSEWVLARTAAPGRSRIQAGLGRLRGKLLVSSLVILALAAVAGLAPWLAPYSPSEQDLLQSNRAPSGAHWLGTDVLGRDVLSRMMWGTRVSLAVGVAVVAMEIVIGAGLGLVAGYRGGWLDLLALRMADVTLAFPPLLFAILTVALLGPSLLNILVALMLVGWPELARLVRSEVLGLRALEFVEAAHALGARPTRVLGVHLVPNVANSILVQSSLRVGQVIVAESVLSFLGIGLQPPTPSWGSMISEGLEYIRTAPHLTVFPGAGLVLIVLAFNFLGEGLRDALDPRLARTER
ncbi:MAG TPA: ABC transporter permease [Methylomirabilota bacterium]|nr:ABC transporter permease [Methylomirabilota bacterium]